MAWRHIHRVNLCYWCQFWNFLRHRSFCCHVYVICVGLFVESIHLLGPRVHHREDGWIRDETHLLVPIDCLHRHSVVLTLHGWWRLETMLCLIIGGIDAVRRSLTILLSDEESVLQDGRASRLGWLLPAYGDCLLGKRFDVDMSWLGNTYHGSVCLIKYAIRLNIWLFEVKCTWIGNSDALRVDAVTAFKAEGDPVLLAYVRLVER